MSTISGPDVGVAKFKGERRAVPPWEGIGRTRQLQAGSVIFFLVLWYMASFKVHPIILPSPTAVGGAFVRLATGDSLWDALYVSLIDVSFGFFTAVLLGIALGVVMGRINIVDVLMTPLLNFLNVTPVLVLIPLIVIWLGVDVKARVAIVFFMALLPVWLNTLEGIKATNVRLREVARAFRLTEKQYVFWIAVPNAVPYILTGIRIGLGDAVSGMIAAELLVQMTGLGGLVKIFGQNLQTDLLIAGILITSLFGVMVMTSVTYVQTRFFSWISATAARRR